MSKLRNRLTPHEFWPHRNQLIAACLPWVSLGYHIPHADMRDKAQTFAELTEAVKRATVVADIILDQELPEAPRS